MPCPPENELLAWLAKPSAHPETATHLDACFDCQRLVAALSDSGTAATTQPPPSPAAPAPALEPGASLNRFVILATAGAGAMGTVYAAYDPSLDRRVALKVLREGSARGEARALAQVNHPNVVQIYEVGAAGTLRYLAMEFVAGGTLADWLVRTKPDWRRTATMLAGAARGLSAVHEAGFVHRDLKPKNVLVTRDGRALVSDFGLAVDGLVDGKLAGTPAYLAPELGAQPANERSDQFAFGVLAYEALHGRRPHLGKNLAELWQQTSTPPAKENASVPAALHRVVLRMMSADPQARFATMAEAATALERAVAPPSRRGLLALGGLVAASALAAAGLVTSTPRCPSSAEQLAGLWDSGSQQALRTHLIADRPHEEEAWRRFSVRFGGYLGQWADARTEACRATARRGAGEAEHAVVRCLETRRTAALGLRDALAAGTTNDLMGAGAAVDRLPAVSTCQSASALGWTDAQTVDHDPTLSGELARAAALFNLGRADESLQRFRSLHARLERDEHHQRRVEGEIAFAYVVAGTNLDEALGHLREAIAEAEALGVPDAMARTWAITADFEGSAAHRESARDAIEHAFALLRGAPVKSVETESLVEFAAASVALRAEDLDRAKAHAQRTLELVGEPPGRLAAAALGVLGVIAEERDDYRAEVSLNERVLAYRLAVLGEAHPLTMVPICDLATGSARLGDWPRAFENADRAAKAAESIRGYTSAGTLRCAGLVFLMGNDLGRAEALLQRAHAAVCEPDHLVPSECAISERATAQLELERHDPAAALAAARRALAHGEGHPDSMTLVLLAQTLVAARADEAKAAVTRAMDAERDDAATHRPWPNDAKLRLADAAGQLALAGHEDLVAPTERLRALFESLKDTERSLAFEAAPARRTLAALCKRLGGLEEAAHHLEVAALLDQSRPRPR